MNNFLYDNNGGSQQKSNYTLNDLNRGEEGGYNKHKSDNYGGQNQSNNMWGSIASSAAQGSSTNDMSDKLAKFAEIKKK